MTFKKLPFIIQILATHLKQKGKNKLIRNGTIPQQIHFKLYNPLADDFLSDCFGWMDGNSE